MGRVWQTSATGTADDAGEKLAEANQWGCDAAAGNHKRHRHDYQYQTEHFARCKGLAENAYAYDYGSHGFQRSEYGGGSGPMCCTAWWCR